MIYRVMIKQSMMVFFSLALGCAISAAYANSQSLQLTPVHNAGANADSISFPSGSVYSDIII